MTKVSALIIAKNESDRIGRCVKSLINVVDEVVVVDTGSTDDTIEVAQSYGAKVYSTEWLGYGQSKNHGHGLVQNDWVLSIDSDEYLSIELAEELINLKIKENIVYQIDRQNIYLGTPIRYSGWSPDWVQRLFNKHDVQWNDNLVHEKLIIPKQFELIKLKSKLNHNSYRSYSDHKAKIDKYAELKAKSWIEKGTTPGVVKVTFGAGFKAFQSYVLKFGFLDGNAGWTIAKMNAHLVRQQIKFFRALQNENI